MTNKEFICKVCNKPVKGTKYYSPFISGQYERVHLKCKPELFNSMKTYGSWWEL